MFGRRSRAQPAVRTALGPFVWDGTSGWSCDILCESVPTEQGRLTLEYVGREFDSGAARNFRQILRGLSDSFASALSEAAAVIEGERHRPDEIFADCLEIGAGRGAGDFVLHLGFRRWPDGMLRVEFEGGRVASWRVDD